MKDAAVVLPSKESAAVPIESIEPKGSTIGPETKSAATTIRVDRPERPAVAETAIATATGPVVEGNAAAVVTAAPPMETAPVPMDSTDLQRVRSGALTFLCLLATMYTLYFAQAVLMPLTFGLILALLLRPVVRRLSKWRIPEAAAAGFALGTVVLIVGLAAYHLLAPATTWLDSLPESLEIARAKLQPMQRQLDDLGTASEKMQDIAKGESTVRPLEVEVRQSRLLSNFTLLSTTGGFLASIAVTFTFAYFLLCHGDRLLSNALGLVPTFRAKRNLVELVTKVQNGVSSYLFTVTAINAGLGVAIGTSMWLLGLPNPALWGLLAAALNYVPYVGALVTSGVVFFVALLQADSLGAAAIAPLACFGINAIEGNFVTPSLVGRSMSLNPILVFFALAFWGWMWGIGGALLAVPLLAVLKASLDQFERTQPLGALLGS